MLSKYLLSLEDPDHPLLGPTLWGLKCTIMCRFEKGKIRIICSLLYLLVISHLMFQYIQIYCQRDDLKVALKNFSITIVLQVCGVKLGAFIIWQKDWMKVMYFVSTLEKRQLEQESQVVKGIIKKYTNYSRSVTYSYWVLVAVSATVLCAVPMVSVINKSVNNEEPNPEIISVWVPFDKTKGFNYWLITFITVIMTLYAATGFAMYDSNAVVLMSFFAGQLEILKLNSENLFGNGEETITYQESVLRIQKIHHHHVQLLKYSRILRGLLSPPMFLYIIMCSVTMCTSAKYLTTDGVILREKIWSAEYLAAQVFQLFMYCWHSQKILEMSLKVSDGVYSSAWRMQEVRVRRSVLLLVGQLNKTIVFTAGQFSDLNVATFVTIVKGAYSYYTLLNSVSDKN